MVADDEVEAEAILRRDNQTPTPAPTIPTKSDCADNTPSTEQISKLETFLNKGLDQDMIAMCMNMTVSEVQKYVESTSQVSDQQSLAIQAELDKGEKLDLVAAYCHVTLR